MVTKSFNISDYIFIKAVRVAFGKKRHPVSVEEVIPEIKKIIKDTERTKHSRVISWVMGRIVRSMVAEKLNNLSSKRDRKIERVIINRKEYYKPARR